MYSSCWQPHESLRWCKLRSWWAAGGAGFVVEEKEEVESNLYDLWLQKLIQHPFQNFRLLLNQLSSHTRACVGSFWPWDSAPGQLAPPGPQVTSHVFFFYGEFQGEVLVALPWRFCCGQFHHDAFVLRVKVHQCGDGKGCQFQTNLPGFPDVSGSYQIEVLSIASIALGLTLFITALHIIAMEPLHWISSKLVAPSDTRSS